MEESCKALFFVFQKMSLNVPFLLLYLLLVKVGGILMEKSQRGKKFNDDIKEKALALLATNNNAKFVADNLGLKYTTVKTWEKKFLEQANTGDVPQDKDLVALRKKKKAEFVDNAWEIIEKTQNLLMKRIERALYSEDKIDQLLEEILLLDNKDLSQEQRKALYRKISTIKVEDVGKIATVLGTIYDKQALASNEPTSRVEGNLRLEDLIKKVEDKSEY